MNQPIKTLILLWMISLSPALALAQADCPAIIQAALNATDQNCDATGRNQACYGNIELEAMPQVGIAALDFEERGDQVDVANVSTLTLSPWDQAENTWGIALMKLQTSLPDTLPGQNVTFLLFGDVQIENRVETNTEPVTFEVTASGTAYLRGEASSDAEFTGELPDGESAMVIGRSADSEWILLELSDQSTGWTPSNSVGTDGDLSLLNVIGPTTAPLPTPMQAFYFQTGIADAPCAEAPDSGILVQTPEGAAQVEFMVNEVNIRLGSTIYLQAQPAGDMTISVVEGQARVEALGVTVLAPAGTQVRVPLDNNRQASGPPVGPESYGNLSALPVRILDRAITVAAPLTEEQIATLGVPIAGIWEIPAWRSDEYVCSDGSITALPTAGSTASSVEITIEENGSVLAMYGSERFRQVGPGVYVSDPRSNSPTDLIFTFTLRILASDQIEIVLAADHSQTAYSFPCGVVTNTNTAHLVNAAESEATPEATAEPPNGTSSQPTDGIELISGDWQVVNVSNECNTPNPETFFWHIVFEVEVDSAALTMTTTTPDGSTIGTYTRTEQNTYFLQASAIGTNTLHFLSPNHFIIESLLNDPPVLDNCTAIWDFTLTAAAEEGS